MLTQHSRDKTSHRKAAKRRDVYPCAEFLHKPIGCFSALRSAARFQLRPKGHGSSPNISAPVASVTAQDFSRVPRKPYTDRWPFSVPPSSTETTCGRPAGPYRSRSVFTANETLPPKDGRHRSACGCTALSDIS